MQQNNGTVNESTPYFTRCLGTYHLLARPTGSAFSTYISVIVVLSIFSVLSALGNGVIIYVYLKQKSLQRTNTFLLVCLAFLDFVSAVVLEPLYVVRLLSEIFGFTSCVYILIVRRLLEYLRPVSFMTLALITIERYLALFKAITHRRMATKRRLLYVVLLIWFVWFLVIGIRSFFPTITSAFYTFFTFVAFSLLVGNLCLYFKIGKLARLHSRPTRVSTAPGSLSVGYENPTSRDPGSLTVGYENPRSREPGSLTVGYENPRSISPGSTDSPAVMYSNTEESVNYVLNKKRGSSTKVGFQSSESVVKLPTSNESISKLECSEKDMTDDNHNSLPDPESKPKHLTQDACEAKDTSEATNIEVINGGSEQKDGNANDTANSTSLKTFENTSQGTSYEKEIVPKVQNSTHEFKTTDNSTNPTDKTNKSKSTHRTTERLSFKNTAKLLVETRERNATWTVFYIVAILTLCYAPISALLLYLSFQKEPDATLLFIYVPIADTITLFNALVNPFIYCYKNRKMRAAVKNVLQKTRSA